MTWLVGQKVKGWSTVRRPFDGLRSLIIKVNGQDGYSPCCVLWEQRFDLEKWDSEVNPCEIYVDINKCRVIRRMDWWNNVAWIMQRGNGNEEKKNMKVGTFLITFGGWYSYQNPGSTLHGQWKVLDFIFVETGGQRGAANRWCIEKIRSHTPESRLNHLTFRLGVKFFWNVKIEKKKKKEIRKVLCLCRNLIEQIPCDTSYRAKEDESTHKGGRRPVKCVKRLRVVAPMVNPEEVHPRVLSLHLPFDRHRVPTAGRLLHRGLGLADKRIQRLTHAHES